MGIRASYTCHKGDTLRWNKAFLILDKVRLPVGQLAANTCTGWLLSAVEYVSPTPGLGRHRADQSHAPSPLQGVHDPASTRPCALLT